MSKFLKGNYDLPKRKKRSTASKKKKDLTDKFEESALANLGGSLCFVMNKKAFLWEGGEGGETGEETD